MRRLKEFLAGLLRAGSVIVASWILLLPLGGCVTGDVVVGLRPYEAQATERRSPAEPSAKVRVEAVKDARSDAVGGLIGERTVFDKPMGSIALSPLPTDVIAQMLRTELVQMGSTAVSSAEEFTISAQLRKFQIVTPNTALYWDINGVIELNLAVTAQGEKKHDANYVVDCTDRTYASPNEEIIGKVVSACVGSLGAKLRGDATLTRLIGGR